MKNSIKKTKTIRMKPSLIKELEEIAVKENRNLNNLIETILIKYCEDNKDLITYK